jgi:hypothetical protein
MAGARATTAPSESRRFPRRRNVPPRTSPSTRLILWQLAALAGQVAAVGLARAGQRDIANILTNVSFAVAYGSALWVLIRPQLSRTERNLAVACIAVTPTLMWRANDPLLFTSFDEQLHMRTLMNIVEGRTVFGPNPLLQVSARYPGLEAITAMVHQFGLPVMAAATLVIFIARLALVAVLCSTVEHLTGSTRAGGIAVAVYALSPQFITFNSMFAYQTVALPLALAAVSLIARARKSDDPFPLYFGAGVCLLALAMTHHLISFTTTAFLIVWALFEKGRARLSVVYGALAAVAATFSWAAFQSRLLRGYLEPIFDDYSLKVVTGERRNLFQEESKAATSPLPDRILLVYYAAALCLIVAALMLSALRMRREQPLRGPDLLLLALAVSVPGLCAAFLLPKGGELFCRSSSLLFIPLSLLVADHAVRRFWPEPAPGGRSKKRRNSPAARLTAVTLLAGMFVGGFVMGSGPNWSRLPGPYMVAADPRSMDAETLAAADWAAQTLPRDSRIAADRVASLLLASRGMLWPVMQGPGEVDTAALYYAPHWGRDQTDMARVMRLRYLYVDRRMEGHHAPYGFHFYHGDSGRGRTLSEGQLTKFDSVPGIELIYRHGPVSIYDLKRLGIGGSGAGQSASDEPKPPAAQQLALGAALGILISAFARSRLWPRVLARADGLYRTTGPPLALAITLASGCLAAIAMLLTGAWPTQLAVLSAVIVVVVANHRLVLSGLRRVAAKMSLQRLRVAAVVGIPLVMILGVAVLNSTDEVHNRVEQILHRTVNVAPR